MYVWVVATCPSARSTATETGFSALEDGRILFADEDGAGVAWAAAPEGALDLASAPGGAAVLSHLQARGRRQAVFTRVAQPALEQPETRAEDETPPGTIAAGDGYLLCSAEDALGVRVRHVAADGRELFSVRTPIHTAADRLVWELAEETKDGCIRLSGYYETDGANGLRRQRATALLGMDGVLRELKAEE